MRGNSVFINFSLQLVERDRGSVLYGPCLQHGRSRSRLHETLQSPQPPQLVGRKVGIIIATCQHRSYSLQSAYNLLKARNAPVPVQVQEVLRGNLDGEKLTVL